MNPRLKFVRMPWCCRWSSADNSSLTELKTVAYRRERSWTRPKPQSKTKITATAMRATFIVCLPNEQDHR